MTNDNDLRIIEALIFASEKAVHIKDIKKKLPNVKDIDKLLLSLRDSYQKRGINLNVSNKSWYFHTAPDLADSLKEYKIIKKKQIINICFNICTLLFLLIV